MGAKSSKNSEIQVDKPAQVAAKPGQTVAAKSLEKGKEAVEGVKNAIGKLMDGDKMALIVFILVVIITFVIVILYIIYALRSNNLTASKVNKTPIEIHTIQTPVIADTGLMPAPLSGTEFALSLWIYVDSMNTSLQTSGSGEPYGNLILYQGASTSDISGANFITFMDATTNKLYIAMKTINNSLDQTCNDNIQNIIKNNYFMNKHLSLNNNTNINSYVISAIDYIPLQRWVNIAIIIDNKLITTMIDGEIYSIQTTDQIKSSRDTEYDANNSPINNPVIIDMPSGSLFIGKNPSIGRGNVVSGYVGNVNYWNYAPSINDLKNFYNNGPIGGWSLLRKLGISYGIRSPLYKLGQ